MRKLADRLDHFSDSVIRRMTRIANEYQAINLSQGFPDFDPPKELIQALKQAAEQGPHQYEITWGSKEFRQLLAKKQQKLMNIDINPDENVLVTCGSTEAMMCAVMTICNPKDKVIIFSPFYENYGADAILSDATPIYVPLIPPTFEFDKKQLRQAFEQGAKALILCNPSNPCGKVFTKAELDYISQLVIEFDAYVITDEVYEHMVYAPHKHLYLASFPGMKERTISCSSLSKTYSITGWRLGYIIADKTIIDGCKMIHDFLTVGAAAPLQKAACAGLSLGDDYYQQLTQIYTEKRQLFLQGLDKIGLSYYEPQGAYYVLVDISAFNPFKTDFEFCEWLIKEVGVAAVPGSAFFKHPEYRYIRFHFAKQEQTLIAALQRLSKFKEKLLCLKN
ncbi:MULTISPECIES: pyridoxal phosphate-dependent aminotransferase [unclassified Gilliamella]|uniref:pyridoxal phosphate-dependent aminotransferase n=1 Tax=unclassified Gilliamella TaxID=2685620 RepID=UPI002269FA1C|nr:MULTISPECIES: pyridoxal phosphate-dependent aminotransferase [unclassified Gilliamella]MCX8642341.1 pyridoxal phosphate-dependent aminotransferase [Gilliamella sp. B3835]MCX8707739.1 pyridoxal phosphate-dependent aminotransferase [Gilliamella sp. B3783]MCX8709312.1 pyridoxal phosphate-dependent aminotransferase [Gilliamella sp. B3780]MCX8715198.1 pyridoxal phosphate-dependent aminotransferase [Gilliamella sp. B3781]MCX8716722.1 pyridoxal phosphate-dependent aminotransferase [Gilliamella sp.